MRATNWIDEVPHTGVKGEFVRKIGPSGWEEENEPNREHMGNLAEDEIEIKNRLYH